MAIRRMHASQLDQVTEIWLQGNLSAHDFIPAAYWHGQRKTVNAQLAQAEIYVHEGADGAADGFIGLQGRGFPTSIETITVDPDYADFCKSCKKCAEACPTGALKILSEGSAD